MSLYVLYNNTCLSDFYVPEFPSMTQQYAWSQRESVKLDCAAIHEKMCYRCSSTAYNILIEFKMQNLIFVNILVYRGLFITV